MHTHGSLPFSFVVRLLPILSGWNGSLLGLYPNQCSPCTVSQPFPERHLSLCKLKVIIPLELCFCHFIFRYLPVVEGPMSRFRPICLRAFLTRISNVENFYKMKSHSIYSFSLVSDFLKFYSYY